MRIDFDMPVSCVDGAFGELADVVINPSSRRVTHVVVQPHERWERARLMPIEAVQRGDVPGGISLTCTIDTVTGSEPILESAYMRSGEFVKPGSDWDVGVQDAYPVSDGGSLGPEILGAGVAMEYDPHVGVNYHRIPKGHVEIRRASAVTSADGHRLGHVAGFVIDDDNAITGLVLQHGHLWGKRMVAIPGPAIERVNTDELVLTLSADEVGELKPLPGHHWRL